MRQLRIKALARPALREGLLCGLIFGLILLVISLIANFDANTSTVLNYVLILGGYTYAGYRAAKTSKRIKTGALSGAIAGSIAYLIYGIALTLVIVINIDTIRKGMLADPSLTATDKALYTNQYIISAYLFQFLIQLLIVGTALGAILGTFGGFMGKRNRSSPAVATVASTADAPAATIVDAHSPSDTDTVEPSQSDATAEEVASSPNTVTNDVAEISSDEITDEAIYEEIKPSQDETQDEEIVKAAETPTPAPTLKKNYRNFLSR